MDCNLTLTRVQSKHTSLEALKLLVVTWNVNARTESVEELRGLIFPHDDEPLLHDSPPEIVVVGLQELVCFSVAIDAAHIICIVTACAVIVPVTTID